MSKESQCNYPNIIPTSARVHILLEIQKKFRNSKEKKSQQKQESSDYLNNITHSSDYTEKRLGVFCKDKEEKMYRVGEHRSLASDKP